MKSIILLICGIISTYSLLAKPIEVNEKVKKMFHKTFSNIEKVDWYEDDKIFTARFTQNGVITYVKYDEEGDFLSSRRYYNAEHLPVDIRVKLHKRYPDKKIYIVTELVEDNIINYFIKLEDDKCWYTIKVDSERQMSRIEKYIKG